MTAPEIYEYRGVEGLVAAEILCDDNSTESGHGFVTDTPFPIAGVAEIGKTSDSAQEAHYYDNMPAVVVTSTGSDTVTITASAIPLDVKARLTGQTYDSTTGMLIEGERETKYFAIGYRTGTVGANGKEVFVWRLKGSFAVPDETSATENNGTDANGQTLVYTGISTAHKFTKTGKKAMSVVVDTGLDLIANKATFFDSVQTPDTVQPKTVTPSVSVVPSRETIEVGGSVRLSATVIPATAPVTWSSSNTSYATVNASTGLVTGAGAGTATITATITVDGTSYTDTATVIVDTPSA